MSQSEIGLAETEMQLLHGDLELGRVGLLFVLAFGEGQVKEGSLDKRHLKQSWWVLKQPQRYLRVYVSVQTAHQCFNSVISSESA